VQLTITKKQLADLDACSEGVKALANVMGQGDSWTVEWTREKQIELMLTPVGKFIGWAYDEGLIPLWSMNGASLVGASLDGARLDRAKICLCGNGPCVRLRDVLAAAGWVPGADGLLEKVQVTD